MTTMPILVTGASGSVGRHVVAELIVRGVQVRAASRRQSTPVQAGVEAVRLDFRRPDTFTPAVDGTEAVFLIRPPAISRVTSTVNRFVDSALSAGVERIVYVSVAGADTNRFIPHHRIERHLIEAGARWTMLRPGFFAQNLETAYRRDITREDRIQLPVGDGRVAFVDTRDIARAAATALLDDTHAHRAYHLTGPAAVDFHHLAATLSTVAGRPIAYHPCSPLTYLHHLTGRQRLPVRQAIVQTVLHMGLRGGDAAEVTRDLGELIGRPPRHIDTYIADHAQLWQRA